MDSYSVGAYFYQMKPLKKEIYSGLLDSLRAVCEKEQKKEQRTSTSEVPALLNQYDIVQRKLHKYNLHHSYNY